MPIQVQYQPTTSIAVPNGISLTLTQFLSAGTTITAAGNISSTAGNVTAFGTVTGAIVASTGNTTVGQDLTVTRDVGVGRNIGFNGNLNVQGGYINAAATGAAQALIFSPTPTYNVPRTSPSLIDVGASGLANNYFEASLYPQVIGATLGSEANPCYYGTSDWGRSMMAMQMWDAQVAHHSVTAPWTFQYFQRAGSTNARYGFGVYAENNQVTTWGTAEDASMPKLKATGYDLVALTAASQSKRHPTAPSGANDSDAQIRSIYAEARLYSNHIYASAQTIECTVENRTGLKMLPTAQVGTTAPGPTAAMLIEGGAVGGSSQYNLHGIFIQTGDINAAFWNAIKLSQDCIAPWDATLATPRAGIGLDLGLLSTITRANGILLPNARSSAKVGGGASTGAVALAFADYTTGGVVPLLSCDNSNVPRWWADNMIWRDLADTVDKLKLDSFHNLIFTGRPSWPTALDFTTATAGVRTLPANPVGFLGCNVNGSPFKIPYYNV